VRGRQVVVEGHIRAHAIETLLRDGCAIAIAA
jgi:hypothetical protein